MKRKSETISIRVDENLARLIDESRSTFGISRGDWVRGVVMQRVMQSEEPDDADEIRNVQMDLDELRREQQHSAACDRRMLFAILTRIGKLDKEAAKDTVHRVFNGEASEPAQ